MTQLEDIVKIFEQGQTLVNIECSSSDHEKLVQLLLPVLRNRNAVILSKDEMMYDFMSVKQYLEFFSDLKGTTVDLFDVSEMLNLSRFLQVKLSKLTPSIKKRVFLARALMVSPEIIVIEEPLMNVERDSAKILVTAIESISKMGVCVLSTSNSFRSISLLPGNSYHIREGSLIPIYESIDFKALKNEDLNHPIIEIKTEGKTLLVAIEDILFAESIDSVGHVYIKNSYVPTNFTLEELEAKLKDYNFFRSHRSYLVNVAIVGEIQQWTRNSYVLTLNGVENIEIPLSKRRYQDFKDQLHSA